jgi:GNAT superfamily N-acetyltransferase
MDYVIEEVRDLDQVWPELTQLFRELHEYHVPMWSRDFVPNWQERWREHLRLGEDRHILLARENGVAAGYMNAGIVRSPSVFEETFCQIGDAYVRPDLRRRGLGADLLSQVEVWARTRGVQEARLGVVAANQIGMAFWTKSGFSVLTHTMTKSLKSESESNA